MHVLVPVDESDCSARALDHGVALARRHDGAVEVIHYTEKRTETSESFRDRLDRRLADEGFDDGGVEVVTDVRLGRLRAADHIGKRVLGRAADRDADHVVMGHHGTGRMGRALLGSAAETVVRGSEVPVTVVP
jgi:nucleotide-binding universal stress UspA family protein